LNQAYEAELTARKLENRELFERAYRKGGYRMVLLLEAEEQKKKRSLVEAACDYAQLGEKEHVIAVLEPTLPLAGQVSNV
jgi:hypothetical protein